MKLSIATTVLVSSCAVNAFQTAAPVRKITSLNTIALNPFGNNKVETPQPELEKDDDSFDMTGIAVSVSEKTRNIEGVGMEERTMVF